MRVTRRRLLAGAVTVSTGALAGCAGETDDGGDGGGGDEGPPGVDSFRSRITQELDITVETLEERDREVVLVYESTRQTESGRWGYEVGFISARFARLVADGWDVDGLAATVTGREGRRRSWTVSAETGRAFIDDEITVDEFVDRVFDSMTEE